MMLIPDTLHCPEAYKIEMFSVKLQLSDHDLCLEKCQHMLSGHVLGKMKQETVNKITH